MIAGIGVDIVEISRMEHLLKRFGERIARRLLTEHELMHFRRRGDSALFLASRFAAKEAASKALGTGIAQGVGFHSIEVVNDAAGKPALHFFGAASDLLRRRHIDDSFLSLSDEKHYCVAMVILQSGA